MTRPRQITYAVLLGMAALILVVAWAPTRVAATPHTGQSSKVAVIGSPDGIHGGDLTVSGSVGGLGDFTFTNLDPASVTGSALSAFDTVVLYVASPELDCDVGTLSASAEAALVSFVGAGGKMIIYDSECVPQDYSWLPYPFTTSNPGARGANGTATIVEDNLLANSSAASPHFIDAAGLGSNSDAIGDMNVMTTFDPNWCLSMSGTNVDEVTGPVHTYARYKSGMLIYNGMDIDDMGDESSPPFPNGLEKVWLQELQLPLHPTVVDLPCGVTVVGIALAPATATNPIGTTHTVTATLKDLLGAPQPGVLVEFSVTAGPNTDATGTCSPNTDCTTDASGEVSFTYSDTGGAGTDSIEACIVPAVAASAAPAGPTAPICSQTVTKTWQTTSGGGGGISHPPVLKTATPNPTSTPRPAPTSTLASGVLGAEATPRPPVSTGILAPDTGTGPGEQDGSATQWALTLAALGTLAAIIGATAFRRSER